MSGEVASASMEYLQVCATSAKSGWSGVNFVTQRKNSANFLMNIPTDGSC